MGVEIAFLYGNLIKLSIWNNHKVMKFLAKDAWYMSLYGLKKFPTLLRQKFDAFMKFPYYSRSDEDFCLYTKFI